MSSYIPDVIPQEDRVAVEKILRDGKTNRIGFGKKPALLVIDMSNYAVMEDLPSGDKRILGCVKNIRELADLCRERRVPVIYTVLVSVFHASHEAIRGRWVKLPTISDEKNEFANAIYHEIAPKTGDIVLQKDKASAFFGTQLASILTYLGVDTVLVTGVATSGCVRATVCDGFQYNYRVIVPEECTFDSSQISHKVNLFDIDARYADVVKMKEVVDYLRKLGPS